MGIRHSKRAAPPGGRAVSSPEEWSIFVLRALAVWLVVSIGLWLEARATSEPTRRLGDEMSESENTQWRYEEGGPWRE